MFKQFSKFSPTFEKHFDVMGNRDVHYGFFECSTDNVSSDSEETGACC